MLQAGSLDRVIWSSYSRTRARITVSFYRRKWPEQQSPFLLLGGNRRRPRLLPSQGGSGQIRVELLQPFRAWFGHDERPSRPFPITTKKRACKIRLSV